MDLIAQHEPIRLMHFDPLVLVGDHWWRCGPGDAFMLRGLEDYLCRAVTGRSRQCTNLAQYAHLADPTETPLPVQLSGEDGPEWDVVLCTTHYRKWAT